jgi:NitT/TauT family transport system substrate-binding protein
VGLVVATALTLPVRPSTAQTSIKFTLGGPIEGPVAPFLVAQDRGYYREQELVVQIEQDATVLEPIVKVASGAAQMGIADINALIRWRDQQPNAPVRPIFIVYNQAPYAIIARKSRGIAVPKDLVDKRLGAPVGSATSAQWPLFAKLNGIDLGKVKVEPVGIPVREPMLAAGQIDAVTAFAFRSFIDLRERGVPVDDLLVWRMYEYGVRLYGNAIIVNGKFASEQPQAVRGFLTAVVAGLNDTVRRPAGAIGSVISRNESAGREVELARLGMAIRENILTPDVRAHGYGNVDPARLQLGLEQLTLVQPFKTPPTPAQAFDPSFLPPEEVRRVN